MERRAPWWFFLSGSTILPRFFFFGAEFTKVYADWHEKKESSSGSLIAKHSGEELHRCSEPSY